MIFTPLLPHQEKALALLLKVRWGALFMFPGSGKSLVALSFADRLKAKTILITSDKTNVLNTWPDQIARHTDMRYVVRPTSAALDPCTWRNLAHPHCVVVNYDYLTAHWEEYARIRWDLWIGDESAAFKDHRTARHKALARVAMGATCRVILNGKAATERVQDLYGQISMVSTLPFGSFSQFLRNYMQISADGYGWVPKRSAFTHIREKIDPFTFWLEDTPEIRALLPEVRRIKIPVELTEQQRTLDASLRETFEATLKNVTVRTNYAPVVFVKRVQICGGFLHENPSPPDQEPTRGADRQPWEHVPTGKRDALLSFLGQNPTLKVVVWHSYRVESEILRSLVNGVAPCFAGIQDLVRFQTTEAPAVLLLRTGFCTGLNQLADADVALFWSNPFSYSRRAQAEGRTRRISSTNKITYVVDLVTKGGADEQVYHMLQQKQSFSLTLSALRSIR